MGSLLSKLKMSSKRENEEEEACAGAAAEAEPAAAASPATKRARTSGASAHMPPGEPTNHFARLPDHLLHRIFERVGAEAVFVRNNTRLWAVDRRFRAALGGVRWPELDLRPAFDDLPRKALAGSGLARLLRSLAEKGVLVGAQSVVVPLGYREGTEFVESYDSDGEGAPESGDEGEEEAGGEGKGEGDEDEDGYGRPSKKAVAIVQGASVAIPRACRELLCRLAAAPAGLAPASVKVACGPAWPSSEEQEAVRVKRPVGREEALEALLAALAGSSGPALKEIAVELASGWSVPSWPAPRWRELLPPSLTTFAIDGDASEIEGFPAEAAAGLAACGLREIRVPSLPEDAAAALRAARGLEALLVEPSYGPACAVAAPAAAAIASGVPSLRRLTGRFQDGEALAALAPLPLVELDASHVFLTGAAGLARFLSGPSRSTIRNLSLMAQDEYATFAAVPPEGLLALSRCEGLQELAMTVDKAGGDALASLGALKRLHTLRVKFDLRGAEDGGEKLLRAGAAAVAGMSALKSARFSFKPGERATDGAAMGALAAATAPAGALRAWWYLDECKGPFTEAEAAGLAKALAAAAGPAHVRIDLKHAYGEAEAEAEKLARPYAALGAALAGSRGASVHAAASVPKAAREGAERALAGALPAPARTSVRGR
eukprot:tig00000057_g138.t1